MKDAKQNFNKSSCILDLEETHLLHQTEMTFKVLVARPIVPYITDIYKKSISFTSRCWTMV